MADYKSSGRPQNKKGEDRLGKEKISVRRPKPKTSMANLKEPKHLLPNTVNKGLDNLSTAARKIIEERMSKGKI